MKFFSGRVVKIVSLLVTAILFIIPYIDKNCSNNLILILSGITLTLYIIAAVFEEKRKIGRW